MGELVVIFVGLDADEGQRQEDGAGMKKLEPAKLVHLARGPSHHRRYTGSDEHHSVGSADRDVEPAVRPITFRRADPQQNVRGEERAEEHDFGGQKQPDADFGVVKAGILARLDDVGEDFHLGKLNR